MFRPIPYIEWFVERDGVATHDLARSDLRPAPPDGAGGETDPTGRAAPTGPTGAVGAVVPPRLAALPDPGPDGPSAETLLADRYGVAEANVALTAGTSHANALVAATVLDHPDDVPTDDRSRVLCETPGYQPHHLTPASLGADVWRFRRDDGGLDPDRVAGAIDDTVDLVTLSNRHNPTGRLVARETLRAVSAVCADHDAVLLVDEVYAPFTVGDDTGPFDGPFGSVTAAGLPNTVVTNSLTKFFGFGGLRFGWAVGDRDLTANLGTTARHVPDLAEPSRVLGRRALANADALAADCRDLLTENHSLLESFVAERDDLSGAVPAGSTFAILRFEPGDDGADSDGADSDGADSDVADNDDAGSATDDGDRRDQADRRDDGDRIAEAAWDRDVFVVPGRFFGVPDSIRVSLGGRRDEMESALAAFGEVLDEQ